MYSFIQSFTKKMIEKGFRFSSISHTEQKDSIIVFLKKEGHILYVVSLVNGEEINLQKYEVLMQQYLNSLQNTLQNDYCSKMIALTIVIGEFLKKQNEMKEIIGFVTKKELLSYDNYFYACWYVSNARKSIEMSKSQPKDVLNIRKIIMQCLQGEQHQSNDSLQEIAFQAKQNTAFHLKSRDVLLTWNLICINCFLFLVMILFHQRENAILLFGAQHQAIFDMNEYYRIITSCFIHTNAMHLVQNIVYLYFFGIRTEVLYGKIQMGIIYFFSMLGGSFLSALFNDAISVGASGAIFGLIGAVLVYSYKHGKKSVGMDYMTLLFFVIIALLAGIFQQNVDYLGHFGGFFAGCITAFLLLKMKI